MPKTNIPQNSSVQSQPPSSQKYVFIFIILLFLSLGAVGFLAYQNNQLRKQIDSLLTVNEYNDNQITSANKPVISLSSQETPLNDNWLIYSGSNTCYSFKYPSNLSIDLENGPELTLSGPTQKQNTEIYDGIYIHFSSPLNLGGKTLSQYIDSSIEEAKIVGQLLKPKQGITVNGIAGFKYTFQGLGTFEHFVLQSKDQKCTVDITNGTVDPTNQGYQKTVNQILSTFEFK